MKTKRFKNSVLGACTALALAGFLNSGQAAFTPNVDSYVNAFDASTDTASWFAWYNWAANIYQQPNVYNPATAGNAGSMEIDLAGPWAQPVTQQIVIMGTFDNQWQWDENVSINANLYTNIIFDVLVNSNCVVNPNGDFGGYYVGFMTPAGMVQAGFISMPAVASNHWVHCVLPISKTLSGDISAAWGLYLQSTHWWDQDPSTPPSGGLTNYIDNLEVEITPGPPPPPPSLVPTMIQKAVPGVNCNATVAGNAAIDDRYSIITTNTVGYGPRSGHTVTYTWNITQFPNDPNGFQANFMLSCGADSGTPNGNGGPGPYDNAVDWNWGNVILVTIQGNTDGSAYMNFRYKTNLPAGNSLIWGTLWATVSASSPIGQWSVSINKDSGLVTLTSPQNTASFTMDAASLALFTDPLALTLGGQPNDLTGQGQGVVFSNFTATGCVNPISENFATETAYSSLWFQLAGAADSIQVVPPTGGVIIGWTRPDVGYAPELSSNLLANFAPVTPVATYLNVGYRSAIIPQAPLGPDQNFFRLLERSFTQLQILLPGMTATPGTSPGYSGTPTHQTMDSSGDYTMSVIVNAVSVDWYVISGVTDTTELTSANGTFFVANTPAELPLSNGTATYTVSFLDDGSGSATITAQDVTDGTKTSATSPTVSYN